MTQDDHGNVTDSHSGGKSPLDVQLDELLADVPDGLGGAPDATGDAESRGDEDESASEDAAGHKEDHADGDTDAESDAPEDEDAGLSEEHAKALRGLRLLNAPQDVLDGLSEAQAIAWWNSRRAAETKTRREIEELRAKATADRSGGPQGVHTATPDPTPSPDEAAILARLDDEFGPDGRKAIEQLLTLRGRELETLRKQVASVSAANEQRMIDALRTRVGERFPGVLDDERWSSVRESAQALSQQARYREIADRDGLEAAYEKLFVAAALAEGLRETTPEQASRRKQVEAARRATTPNASAHRNAKPVPKDENERWNMIVDLVEAGHGPDEVHRRLG